MRWFLCLAFCFSAVSCAATDEATWLIAADRIYTSPDSPPLLNGHVLVRDGRIVAVADERSRIAIPEGTRTSDCRGVITAGFQNSHVHFMGPPFANAATQPAVQLEHSVESMLTRYGVTTAFDTGSDLANTSAIRARIEKGELRGPRILTAGWPIYPVDGIPFYLNDLPPEMRAQLRQPPDPAAARAAVRENLAGGADGTKLFAVTSPGNNDIRTLGEDIARAAADATHERGKPVLAHPSTIAGIKLALAAGVDVIVHTTLGESAPWDDALTREMVAKRVAVVPTFKLWPYELAKQDVPKDVAERLLDATLEELRAFKAAGGEILFGTDVGYMHDFDPTDEYVLMSRAGLSAMDILASLTTAPAARWNESARRGRVQTGMDADLVVLAGDPAEDVRNFAKVRCVFRAGRLIHASDEG